MIKTALCSIEPNLLRTKDSEIRSYRFGLLDNMPDTCAHFDQFDLDTLFVVDEAAERLAPASHNNSACCLQSSKYSFTFRHAELVSK